jgi:hypothetical protein
LNNHTFNREKPRYTLITGANSGAMSLKTLSEDRLRHIELLSQMILALHPTERFALGELLSASDASNSGAVVRV